jgi:CBS domain-containing protein
LGIIGDYLRGREPVWLRKASGTTAREIMTPVVTTASPDDELRVAARRMLESRYKRLPVVGTDGHLVGIVSRRDVLALAYIDNPTGHLTPQEVQKMQVPSSDRESRGISLTLGDHARDLLRPAVIISRDQSITDIARALRDESVGVAIVGTADEPVGIVSERDVLAALGQAKHPDTVTATEIMTSPVVAVRPEDRLLDVAFLMFDHVVRHIPVIDERGHVTGIVSIRDLLRPLLVDALGGPSSHLAT